MNSIGRDFDVRRTAFQENRLARFQGMGACTAAEAYFDVFVVIDFNAAVTWGMFLETDLQAIVVFDNAVKVPFALKQKRTLCLWYRQR